VGFGDEWSFWHLEKLFKEFLDPKQEVTWKDTELFIVFKLAQTVNNRIHYASQIMLLGKGLKIWTSTHPYQFHHRW
jgi:hypothetical protein